MADPRAGIRAGGPSMSQTTSSRGAKLVTLEQLTAIKAPSPQGRWHPIDHAAALQITQEALEAGGYAVAGRELYVARGGARFIGILGLTSEIAERTSLVVGVTSSTDKSFPFSFYVGYRSEVTGCASFRSDLLVRRKHTTSGEARFSSEVAEAVGKLAGFSECELARIEHLKLTAAGSRAADSVILRAFDRGLIPARSLRSAIRDWREPPYEEFAPRTFWSLANLLSAVVARAGKDDVYRKHVRATMELNALIDAEPELQTAEETPDS